MFLEKSVSIITVLFTISLLFVICSFFASSYNKGRLASIYNAEWLQNCEVSRVVVCDKTVMNRLEKHVKRTVLYVHLIIPNLIVCLCTIVMFYAGEDTTIVVEAT